MKGKWFLFLAGAIFLSSCSTSNNGILEVRDAWMREGLKLGSGAVYVTIVNGTGRDEELIGVSTEIAFNAEIHESMVDGDSMMQMSPLEAVLVPAGGELELKPGGYHIMLMGLTRDIKEGEQVEVTLHFKSSPDIVVTVPVLDSTALGAP